MSRVDLFLNHSTMGLLGSFWSRVVDEKTKTKAREVSRLSTAVPSLRGLEKHASKLLSRTHASVSEVVVPYLDGEYVHIGQDFAKKWRTEFQLPDGQHFQITRQVVGTPSSSLVVSATGRPLGVGIDNLLVVKTPREITASLVSLYVLPLPTGLTPTVIATREEGRWLIHGIDFEAGDGYLILRESPSDLFHAGSFTVTHGKQRVGNPYNFTMQVSDEARGHDFVAAYYRGASSVTSFERAAAQAAGLVVLPAADTLKAVHVVADGVTRYVFAAAGVVDVDYPHIPLAVGGSYPRGSIISDGFRIVGGNGAGWLRAAAGTQSVRMDGACAVSGLLLSPADVNVTYAHVGESGKPHARVGLQGSVSTLALFHEAQRQHELTHGVYLSDQIGLTVSNPTVTINYHALLETFFGNRLLLVVPSVGRPNSDYLRRLEDFVQREKPLGSVVVTLLAATEPLPNLTYNGTGLLLNGIPLSFNA